MTTKRTLLIIVILSLALAAAGAFLQQQMGPTLTTHWNAQGQPDGTNSTFGAIYLLPLIILATGLLVLGIPYLDPLRKNVDQFRPTLNIFALVTAAFLGYVYCLTLAWNIGYRFNMNQMMVPAMGLLIFFTGTLLQKARRNWFIGIRTPWTLSNDLVWEKTHQRGALLFKASGLIALLGIFFPNLAMSLLLVPLLGTTLYVLAYSYFEFQKIARS